MRRPSLIVTVFPVLAFIAGVMVGKYLPLGFLPGPQPGEERDAPGPDQVVSDLGRQLGGLLTRGESDQGEGQENGEATEDEPVTRPSETEPPETSDAAEVAHAFVAQPVLVLAAHSANTFVVQNNAGQRHLLRLVGIPGDVAELEQELALFVGFYLAVDLAAPPLDNAGRMLGTAYVQPRGWQPGHPADKSPERSLNDVIRHALSQRR